MPRYKNIFQDTLFLTVFVFKKYLKGGSIKIIHNWESEAKHNKGL